MSASDDERIESGADLDDRGSVALRSFIEDILFGDERLLMDLNSKSLRPLCRLEATHDAVIVTFDLPYVERKDITLISTENTVSVEAKTRRAVTLKVGGSVQRQVEFERFTQLVRLPRSVDPAKAKATFKNGLLRVRFPIAKKGNRVKIR